MQIIIMSSALFGQCMALKMAPNARINTHAIRPATMLGFIYQI